jgi:hypothetical protein
MHCVIIIHKFYKQNKLFLRRIYFLINITSGFPICCSIPTPICCSIPTNLITCTCNLFIKINITAIHNSQVYHFSVCSLLLFNTNGPPLQKLVYSNGAGKEPSWTHAPFSKNLWGYMWQFNVVMSWLHNGLPTGTGVLQHCRNQSGAGTARLRPQYEYIV